MNFCRLKLHGFHGEPETHVAAPWQPARITWTSLKCVSKHFIRNFILVARFHETNISAKWNNVQISFSFSFFSLFSDLRSLAGTTLLSLLATLFMSQLLFVIGVGGIQVCKRAVAAVYLARKKSTKMCLALRSLRRFCVGNIPRPQLFPANDKRRNDYSET